MTIHKKGTPEITRRLDKGNYWTGKHKKESLKRVLKVDVTKLTKKQVIEKVKNILYELKNKKGKPIEPKYW